MQLRQMVEIETVYLHGPTRRDPCSSIAAYRRLRPSLSRSLSLFLPLSKSIELWVEGFEKVPERSQKL